MLKNKKQFNIPGLNSDAFNKSVRALFDRLGNIFSIGDNAAASQQELNTVLDSSINTAESEAARLQIMTEALKVADKSRLHSLYHITDNPGSFIDKNSDLYDGKAIASGHDPILGNVISLPSNFSKSRIKGPFGNVLATVEISETSGYHPSAGYNIERCVDTKTDTIWYEAAIGSMPITNIPRWAYHKDRWRQVTEPYVGKGDPLSLKYTCPVCGYTYDPASGVFYGGEYIIPAGTLWEDVPAVLKEKYPNLDPQVCPYCYFQGVTTYLTQFIPYDYDPIYAIGPCMQVDIGFDIETVFNQVAINPFSIYPMRITDIRVIDMEGKSKSIITNDVPWIEVDGPTVIAVGDYYDRDEVYAKKVEIVLNQPHYSHGMSDSTRAQQHLDKLLTLLVTPDDVKRFTAPMAFRDLRNLSDKETLFQELAESIIEESANFSNDPGENLVMAAERILGEYMDNTTIDSRFQFEYLYGFREIDLRYVEYTRQARYVSLPIHLKQSPISLQLDVESTENHNHNINAYITPRSKSGSGYMQPITLGEPLYIKRVSIDETPVATVDTEIIDDAAIYNVDTTVKKTIDRYTDTVELKSPVFMDWYTINSRHHGQFEPNSGIITEVPVIGHPVEDEETTGIYPGTNSMAPSADTVMVSPGIDVFLSVSPVNPDIINKMRIRPFYVIKSTGDFAIQKYRVYGGTTSDLGFLTTTAANTSDEIDLNVAAGAEVTISGIDNFTGVGWWENTDDAGSMDWLEDYGYFTHTSAEHHIQYWYVVNGILYQDADGNLSPTQDATFTNEVETDAVWIKAPVLPRGYDGPALNNTITYRSPHPVSVNVTLEDGTHIRQARTKGSILTSGHVQKGSVDGSDEAQLITELLALHDRQSYELEGWHMVDLMPDPDYLQDGIQTRYISGDKNWDPGKPVVLFFDVDPPIDIDDGDEVELSPKGSVWLIQQWLDNYTDGTLTVEDVYQNTQVTSAILRTVYFSSINLEEDSSNNPPGDPSGTKRYDVDHAAGAVNINPGWARHYGIAGSYNIKAIYWHQPDISVSTDGSTRALVETSAGCINKTDYYSLEQPVLKPYSVDYPVIEYLHIGNTILFAQPINGTIEVSHQTLLPSFRIVIDMETSETNGSTPLISTATLSVKSSPAGMRAIDINKV
jgi:rubredoxin